MLTIQPGLIFSAAVVAWIRAAELTDDIIESDLARIESADVPLFAIRTLQSYGRPASYIAALTRAAGAL